jgi:hypothetical protein
MSPNDAQNTAQNTATSEVVIEKKVFSLTDLLNGKGNKLALGQAIQKIFSSGYDSKYIAPAGKFVADFFADMTGEDKTPEVRAKWLNAQISLITSTRHSGKGYQDNITLPMIDLVEVCKEMIILAGIVSHVDGLFKLAGNESAPPAFEDFD